MKYIRASIFFNHVDGDWVVHLRRGKSYFAPSRNEAIEAAIAGLPEGHTLRLSW